MCRPQRHIHRVCGLRYVGMNTFIFDGSWNQIKGVLRQKFAQLTDMDLEFIQGKGEELLGRLQTRLGVSREELERMLQDVKDSVFDGAQAMQEKFGQVKSRVSDAAGKLASGASDIYDEGSRRARGMYAIGKDEVRHNPREAVLAALALGFVIGLLLPRA